MAGVISRLAPDVLKDGRFRRTAKNHVNGKLRALGYTDGIPVGDIVRIVESAGFDGTELHGIYCGAEGRVNASIGYNTYLSLSWYKMASGRFEIVAYVS